MENTIAGKFMVVSDDEICKSLGNLFKPTNTSKSIGEFGIIFDSAIDFASTCFKPEIPKRATTGSAGYDFYAPFTFTLKPGDTIKIPTGIKCQMNPGWVLQVYPRSSLGFKHRICLDNTVGIIDQDYFGNPNNEGHIFIKITYDKPTGSDVTIHAGEAFAQGIFSRYGVTEDDDATGIRNGGIGSTNK